MSERAPLVVVSGPSEEDACATGSAPRKQLCLLCEMGIESSRVDANSVPQEGRLRCESLHFDHSLLLVVLYF